jgi:adenylate cyclase
VGTIQLHFGSFRNQSGRRDRADLRSCWDRHAGSKTETHVPLSARQHRTDGRLYVGSVAAEVDVEALGLLDGLEGEARTERAELIAWLLDRGFSIDQIRASVAPLLLPANRVMGEDGVCLSARQVCEASGLDLELLQRLQGAVGLPRIADPDAAVLPRVDGEAVAYAKVFLDMGVDPDETVAVMRVLIEGLQHAAAMMRQAAFKTLLRPGASEIELAEASEALAQQAVPLVGPMVQALLLLELRHTFETEAVNAAERAAGTLPGARKVAVAFADLAGFTRLGEALPPEDLERVASRLSDLARDVAVAPVQFVKTIGDAVMLVCADPVPLLNAVIDLVAVAAKEGLPRLRVGVASGDAVSRAGDWFGSPVNVASRVTDVARAGTVLVAESAREAIGDSAGFDWAFAGSRHLKGISGEVKLFRVSRSRE